MACVSRAVVKSLVDNYTRDQLVEWQKAATAALMANLPRVELTGTNFENGGSTGEFVGGD